MGFWSTHFAWPGGDVYGNIIASAIATGAAAGLVWWRARVHWHRHVEAQAAKHEHTHTLLRDLHARLDNPTPPEGDGP